MFQNNAGAAPLHQARRFDLANARRHHQHFSFEALLPRQIQKRSALLQAQVDIQQHHISVLRAQVAQPFLNGRALTGHFEIRLGAQQPRNRLAK
jgi:hypothetical protein